MAASGTSFRLAPLNDRGAQYLPELLDEIERLAASRSPRLSADPDRERELAEGLSAARDALTEYAARSRSRSLRSSLRVPFLGEDTVYRWGKRMLDLLQQAAGAENLPRPADSTVVAASGPPFRLVPLSPRGARFLPEPIHHFETLLALNERWASAHPDSYREVLEGLGTARGALANYHAQPRWRQLLSWRPVLGDGSVQDWSKRMFEITDDYVGTMEDSED